ncbi:MAG: hypothetical protein DMD95_15445 [Candidatus Rokuibacteriota bacterium]|nr:MAG: hypothetical protein DMD95_15445 [Candidatus Rokubacteria bacterium]
MVTVLRVRRWGLGVLFAVALTSASASAAPVAVRYAETITHAFLLLRGANGDVLAHGELVQAPVEGQRMQSRLVFRFKDGSLRDETVTFAQQKVFRVMSYHHIERGPSFPASTEVTFDRDTGRYRAKVDDKTDEGKIDLPEDLHNGIIITILKNLTPGTAAAGHMLAFTPKPHLLDTELRAEGEDKFFIGDVARTATRYLVKIELRGLTGVVASIMGKDPPDLRYWVTTGPAPGFVKLEGPMYLKGPRWRVELPGPRWPER